MKSRTFSTRAIEFEKTMSEKALQPKTLFSMCSRLMYSKPKIFWVLW